jgi:hypothetical protein
MSFAIARAGTQSLEPIRLGDFPRLQNMLTDVKSALSWLRGPSIGTIKRGINLAENHVAEVTAYGHRVASAMAAASNTDGIGTAISMLLAAFPNIGKTELHAFGALLTRFVCNENPPAIVLDAACDHLIRTMRFVPSISEVLDAIALKRRELENILYFFTNFAGQLAQAKLTVAREEESQRERAALQEFFRTKNPERRPLSTDERFNILAEFNKKKSG